MPTYAIHHVSAVTKEPARRSKNARRIAMGARNASVTQRRTMRRAA